MRLDPTRIALGPAVAGGFPQRAKDIALGPPSRINLLLGALSRTRVHVDGVLPGIALGRHWPHLIDIQDDTRRWRGSSERFDTPLFCANAGSRRSPNQVSCLRQRKPSSCKISKMRVFFIASPSASCR